MKDFIHKQLLDSYTLKKDVLNSEQMRKSIEDLAQVFIQAYKNGNKSLIAGNGGSAADAQHIAGELVSRFYFDRPALPSIALTTDTSILTAIGNDYGYEQLFVRQLQAHAQKGDIFLAISTSGNSKNIIKAIEWCKENGVITAGLSGKDGGAMKEMCDYCICMPSNETPRIQEGHILMGHILCACVEKDLFG